MVRPTERGEQNFPPAQFWNPLWNPRVFVKLSAISFKWLRPGGRGTVQRRGGVLLAITMASKSSKFSSKTASVTARLLASARRLERTERRIYRALCSSETKLACLISETDSTRELIGKLLEDHRRIMSDIAQRRDECGAPAYVPAGMYLNQETSLPESTIPDLEIVEEQGSPSLKKLTPEPMHGLDIFCYETIWKGSPFRDETRSALPGCTDSPVLENLDWLIDDFPEHFASAPDTSGGAATSTSEKL